MMSVRLPLGGIPVSSNVVQRRTGCSRLVPCSEKFEDFTSGYIIPVAVAVFLRADHTYLTPPIEGFPVYLQEVGGLGHRVPAILDNVWSCVCHNSMVLIDCPTGVSLPQGCCLRNLPSWCTFGHRDAGDIRQDSLRK